MNIFLPISTSFSDVETLPVESVAQSLQAAGHTLFLYNSEADSSPYLDQEAKDGFEVCVDKGGIYRKTGLPAEVDDWISTSISDSQARRYVLQSQKFAIIVNADSKQRTKALIPQTTSNLIVIVCPTAQCQEVKPLAEKSAISPLVVSRNKIPRSAIEDGPQLVRFQRLLDDFIYTELGSELFLKDFVWNEDLRLRAEPFGGILFVPQTSKLIELDHKTMTSIEHALKDGQPVDILAYPVSDLSTLVACLYRIGAIKRSKTSFP